MTCLNRFVIRILESKEKSMATNCAICGIPLGLFDKKSEFGLEKICTSCSDRIVRFIPNPAYVDAHQECMDYYNGLVNGPCFKGTTRSYAKLRAVDVENYKNLIQLMDRPSSCLKFDIDLNKMDHQIGDEEFKPVLNGSHTSVKEKYDIKLPGVCPVTLQQTNTTKNVILACEVVIKNTRREKKTWRRQMSFEIPCCVPIEALAEDFSIWMFDQDVLSFYIRNRAYAKAFQDLNNLPDPTEVENTKMDGLTKCRRGNYRFSCLVEFGENIPVMYEDDPSVIPPSQPKKSIFSNWKNPFAQGNTVKTNNQNTINSSVDSEIDALKKYKKLYDEGLITEEEYVAKKKQLMNI